LSTGNTVDSISPLKINGFSDIIDVSAGNVHSMVLNTNGQVYTCGRNAVCFFFLND
jgi:alpha-tubulin suppressor-like RCC1 family protein